MSRPMQCPPSVSNFRINLAGIVLFFITMALVRYLCPWVRTVELALACLVVTTALLSLYEIGILKVYKRSSTGLFDSPGPRNYQRLIRKLIGLYGTFCVILILYYFNPVYRQSPRAVEFYETFFEFLAMLAPWIIGLSFLYFQYIDRRQKEPYDGYWHMGCLLTGRLREVNWVILMEHARVWFIKAFFLPFMLAVLIVYMDEIYSFRWGGNPQSFALIFNNLLDILYSVDIVYGVLGYILTVRWLDTHIQSTDPTWLGWLVCLACYHPFYSIFGVGLFPFEDGFYWDQWLALFPLLYYGCALAIFGLTLMYALATVAFGYRMSNLTYRGIITSGPYRWTKHPAYIGKVGSWWLLSLPFFSVESMWVAIYHTMNLVIISFIYYLRAKTEENHLSNYPEYVAYAEWINEYGIFRWVGRICPALKYSVEKSRAASSVVWFKKLERK